MKLLSRRSFLVASTALAASLALRPGQAGEPEVTPLLLSLFASRAHATTLGRAWLRDVGTVPRAAELSAGLSAKLGAQGWQARGGHKSLRHGLRAARDQDLVRGDVVTVQGWRMARTQAELCALAYLESEGRA